MIRKRMVKTNKADHEDEMEVCVIEKEGSYKWIERED